MLPAAAPCPRAVGAGSPLPCFLGQEGHIPFLISLRLARGGCGCPAGHEDGHSGTGGCDPTATSWHWDRADVRVPSVPGSLCPSVSSSLREGPGPQPCRSPPLLWERSRRPGLKALGARSVAQGWPGAGALSRASAAAGAGSVGRSRAVPVPLRGWGTGRAGAGAWGGTVWCRSRYVGL